MSILLSDKARAILVEMGWSQTDAGWSLSRDGHHWPHNHLYAQRQFQIDLAAAEQEVVVQNSPGFIDAPPPPETAAPTVQHVASEQITNLDEQPDYTMNNATGGDLGAKLGLPRAEVNEALSPGGEYKDLTNQ